MRSAPIVEKCDHCAGLGVISTATSRDPQDARECECPGCDGDGRLVARCYCGAFAVEQWWDRFGYVERYCNKCSPKTAECDGIDRAAAFALSVGEPCPELLA